VAVLTALALPGKYRLLTRMVPKLRYRLKVNLPEEPPAVGSHHEKLVRRVVVIVTPVLSEIEAGTTALAKFFVHSSGFEAEQSKQLWSSTQLSSIEEKLVEYDSVCRRTCATATRT
jgi:hypothetical protein